MTSLRATRRPRFIGLAVAATAISSLALAVPAQAATAKVTGTVKPLARSCATPRVANFKISLKHLKTGKEYIVEWTAPSRSGGQEITEIPIVATASKYVAAKQSSRAATALKTRKFASTITVSAVRPTKANPGRTVLQSTSTVAVPACKRR
ncbi:MAG TPA: hypothetical protein VG253_07540 [Streptosporangiaceae bacterium]|jgi:hypothetical protein|nr:hypothetical protein [Streptosporangiaceae bacterium]